MTFTCCRRNAANVAHSCILRAAQDPSTQRVRRHAGSHPGKNEARASHRPAETEAIPLTRTNHCFHKPPYLQLPCYGPAAGRTPEADVCVPPRPAALPCPPHLRCGAPSFGRPFTPQTANRPPSRGGGPVTAGPGEGAEHFPHGPAGDRTGGRRHPARNRPCARL